MSKVMERKAVDGSPRRARRMVRPSQKPPKRCNARAALQRVTGRATPPERRGDGRAWQLLAVTSSASFNGPATPCALVATTRAFDVGIAMESTSVAMNCKPIAMQSTVVPPLPSDGLDNKVGESCIVLHG